MNPELIEMELMNPPVNFLRTIKTLCVLCQKFFSVHYERDPLGGQATVLFPELIVCTRLACSATWCIPCFVSLMDTSGDNRMVCRVCPDDQVVSSFRDIRLAVGNNGLLDELFILTVQADGKHPYMKEFFKTSDDSMGRLPDISKSL